MALFGKKKAKPSLAEVQDAAILTADYAVAQFGKMYEPDTVTELVKSMIMEYCQLLTEDKGGQGLYRVLESDERKDFVEALKYWLEV